MDKLKKSLMIVSLSALSATCLMLILAVFKVPIFKGVPLRILLILATVSLACAFAISELSVIKRKRVLGFVGIGFLAVSVVMALVVFCSPLLFKYSVFNRIAGIVGLTSVMFIIIMSIYSKLGKSLIGLQIPTYASVALLDILLCLIIGGFKLLKIKGMLEVLIITIICCVGLLIASTVVSSKRANAEEISKPKTEKGPSYNDLLAENEKLKQEIAELKAKLNQQ